MIWTFDFLMEAVPSLAAVLLLFYIGRSRYGVSKFQRFLVSIARRRGSGCGRSAEAFSTASRLSPGWLRFRCRARNWCRFFKLLLPGWAIDAP